MMRIVLVIHVMDAALIRVVAPHFVAGIIIRGGVVIKAAPILAYAKGKKYNEIKSYFDRKNWSVENLGGVE